MDIGVPRERKANEHRVGMTPAGVKQLTSDGHTVRIASGAGTGAGIPDGAYRDAGAEIVDQEDAWDADLVVKIKEPLDDEYDYLHDDLTVFTYFHLAASRELTEAVLDSGITAIAYETVEQDGDLPLLRPMSQVAGRMAPLVAAQYLARHHDGRGVLPGGIPGVPPSDMVVLGGGTVGENAARIAAGIGADVTVLEIDQARMTELDRSLPANVSTQISNRHNIEQLLPGADAVIGAVLIPGGEAPELITRDDLTAMQDGSVIVDVAVDQGGIAATTRPTTHQEPVYTEDGVIHYAVANMPGAYARTATFGITNATLPYVRRIANDGWRQAMQDDAGFRNGLNAVDGTLTHPRVAAAFDMDHVDPTTALD